MGTTCTYYFWNYQYVGVHRCNRSQIGEKGDYGLPRVLVGVATNAQVGFPQSRPRFGNL